MERFTQKESTYYEKALIRLQELENKIESGLMIELPCKFGDTIYEINLRGDKIQEITVRSLWNIIRWKEDNVFGRWLFTTKEQAEAKLKELQGDN